MSDSTTLASVVLGAPTVRNRTPRSVWWTARWPIVIGAAAATLVLILRYAGLLGGFLAIGLGVLCFIFAPGPRRVSDRLLILAALGIGWLPLLGWVPRIGTTIDVPGVVLAISVGVVCGYQFYEPRTAPRAVAIPTVAEGVALCVGAAVTVWWALPFTRLTESGILNMFLLGWDNNTHFGMFRTNVQLGSFIQASPNLPGGVPRVGYDYPQGMHQAWAQAIRLFDPHPSSSVPWLLHSYLAVLLLTTGGIVILGCMAVARLASRDLLATLPVMAIVVALFAVGRFGPLNGFPNWELSVMAAAVGVTLMVRPTMGPIANFLAVAGMGLIVVYNWYPIIIVIAPAVVIAALRARNGCQGHARRAMTALIVATAILYVLPIASFSHRGVSTLLDTSGGGIAAPWVLLIASIAILTGVAIIRQVLNSDLATNFIISAPAILGGGAVLAVVVYESQSAGGVSYYGQKFAAGLFAVCLLVLACVLASDLATSQFRRMLSMPIAADAAVLLAVAALQVDGYVGPPTTIFNSYHQALAMPYHDYLTVAPSTPLYLWQVIVSAQIAYDSQAKDHAEQWWYLDPILLSDGSGYSSFGQIAEWFSMLRGNPSNAEYFYSGGVLGSQFTSVDTPSAAAEIVIGDFPNPIDNHVHLFVPAWLRDAIIKDDPVWGQPGQMVVIPTF